MSARTPSVAKVEPRPRVLVVDDRPGNLLAMTAILDELGHPVVTASSGTEALRILLQNDFAVILLDVNMPGLDGFELSKLIRERERSSRTPIVFVTAISMGDGAVAKGYALGAVDYVFSPIDPSVLRPKIAMFVDLHEKTMELRRRSEELERALKEKTTLIREVHHRVKNNLQLISSLLKLQVFHVPDALTRAAFAASQSRIQAIALVHEKLYTSGGESHVDLDQYIRVLVENLFHAHGAEARGVTSVVDVNGLRLPVDTASPCGLIVNELVTNALMHAFPDGRTGTVRVSSRETTPGSIEVRVSDDGIGLPAELDPRDSGSLGLDLVFTFAAQLGADVEFGREHGTDFRISFHGVTS